MKIHSIVKTLSAVLLIGLSASVFADSSSAGQAIDDSVITGKVKASLAADQVTSATNISVETNNGIVALGGTAQSDTEATRAIELAESTRGVKGVDASQLQVQGSDQPLTDAYITAKVKGTFLRNNLNTKGINVPLTTLKVETKQGVVYLSGTVKSRAQLNKAKELAKSIDGVSKVVYNVKVS